MSNFRVVSRGIKKIVTNHYHDSWLWRYVSTANLFCKIFDFVTNISGRLWSFSRLMARANQSPANPISYVFFVVWKDYVITDTVPSINKCAEHNKITEYFMWWPVCPVDSIYPRLSLLHILGEDKKTDTVLFSSTVLSIWALVNNAMHITILC